MKFGPGYYDFRATATRFVNFCVLLPATWPGVARDLSTPEHVLATQIAKMRVAHHRDARDWSADAVFAACVAKTGRWSHQRRELLFSTAIFAICVAKTGRGRSNGVAA